MSRPPRDPDRPRRPVLGSAIVAASVLVGYTTAPLPDEPFRPWRLAVFLADVLLLAALVTRQVRRLRARPGARPVRLEGLAISLYLVVALFAVGYLLLARDPGQFEGLRTRVD